MEPDTGAFSNVKFSFLHLAFQAVANMIRKQQQRQTNKQIKNRKKTPRR